ncbi:hypothetical protein D0Y65_038128 [Glycine soja]|uniref:Uncharacterized protein n=1 Tax=Glycine soja TaxID=3848 RepID=A0A445H3G4_GLYSO|nr:hypothetical protein D0Y65_038128 [Glycine soja]
MNQKVKFVDQRLQVSDKTMAAIIATERKINDTGSTVKTSSFTLRSCMLSLLKFKKISISRILCNAKEEDIIVVIPWEEWWDFELDKDDSNPHIALLPLHPALCASFNETAAREYALSMAGKPYGYHNMIFSWIDTLNENYPPPLDANVVLI